jgi:hypothetical protein
MNNVIKHIKHITLIVILISGFVHATELKLTDAFGDSMVLQVMMINMNQQKP